jgi:hypothetical protein
MSSTILAIVSLDPFLKLLSLNFHLQIFVCVLVERISFQNENNKATFFQQALPMMQKHDHHYENMHDASKTGIVFIQCSTTELARVNPMQGGRTLGRRSVLSSC